MNIIDNMRLRKDFSSIFLRLLEPAKFGSNSGTNQKRGGLWQAGQKARFKNIYSCRYCRQIMVYKLGKIHLLKTDAEKHHSSQYWITTAIRVRFSLHQSLLRNMYLLIRISKKYFIIIEEYLLMKHTDFQFCVCAR